MKLLGFARGSLALAPLLGLLGLLAVGCAVDPTAGADLAEAGVAASQQAVLVEGDTCYPAGQLDCYHVFECCGADLHPRLNTPIFGTCVDLSEDDENCGGCGVDCTRMYRGGTCTNGGCCPAGQIYCDPECPDGYWDWDTDQYICNTNDPGDPGCYEPVYCFH